jgi:hypothetical protein
MNEDILTDDTFDLPYRNPFQESGETLIHFKHRCNRTMAGLKADQRKLFGGGTVYRNPKSKGYCHPRSAKVCKHAGNGLK